MEPRILKGNDWARHEEKVAKIRHELGDSDIWDIGFTKELTAKFPQHDPAALAEQITEIVPNGFSILNVDGEKVYVFKESERQRLEIGLRADFVELWGEDAIAKFEATILSQNVG